MIKFALLNVQSLLNFANSDKMMDINDCRVLLSIKQIWHALFLTFKKVFLCRLLRLHSLLYGLLWKIACLTEVESVRWHTNIKCKKRREEIRMETRSWNCGPGMFWWVACVFIALACEKNHKNQFSMVRYFFSCYIRWKQFFSSRPAFPKVYDEGLKVNKVGCL